MKKIIVSLSVVLGLSVSAFAGDCAKSCSAGEQTKAAACSKAGTVTKLDCDAKAACTAAKVTQTKKSFDLAEKGGKRLMAL